jgi:hypothetical protein
MCLCVPPAVDAQIMYVCRQQPDWRHNDVLYAASWILRELDAALGPQSHTLQTAHNIDSVLVSV